MYQDFWSGVTDTLAIVGFIAINILLCAAHNKSNPCPADEDQEGSIHSNEI